MGLWRWLTATEEVPEQRATILTETPSGPMSISDPALAEWLGLSGMTDAGIAVNEQTALGLASYYRAVSIVAQTIAALPLKSYRKLDDDSRQRVPSFADNPGGPWWTPFEWVELCIVHYLTAGNIALLHHYNQAGAIAFLEPIHPSLVTVKPIKTKEDRERFGDFRRYFTVKMSDDNTRDLTEEDLTFIPGLGTDGVQGINTLGLHKNAIATALAGDLAAAKQFANGLLLGGLVSADEDLAEEDARAARDGLKAKAAGAKNAGDLAFVNAKLKFTPWNSTAADGQMIESRTFQVNETARLIGIPKVLLAEDGASTWGAGIGQLMRWMSRTTLMPITSRIEQRLSRLLAAPRYCEFDYSGLLQPTAEEEIPLILQQIEKGLLTLEEGRKLRNLPPLGPRPVPEAEEEEGAA